MRLAGVVSQGEKRQVYSLEIAHFCWWELDAVRFNGPVATSALISTLFVKRLSHTENY